MTDLELERLAALIADAMLRAKDATPQHGGAWLPVPVRPEPQQRTSTPPAWSGAGQTLGDIAPVRSPAESPHRPSTAELTRATRAAAAGRAPRDKTPPKTAERPAVISSRGAAARRRNALPITVKIGVSKRHLHLSADDVRRLFGKALTSLRSITQPGQFAANEVVEIVGPKGRLSGVRIVGPARGETQLEIARSDAHELGIEVPVADSGDLALSAGGVTLIGPYGQLELKRGVIVAARHLHLSIADSERYGLRDGDRIDVTCGTGSRATTYAGVLVRAGSTHATELHLDSDEAHAAAVHTGDDAQIIARHEGKRTTRRLITERDVFEISRAKGAIPAGALLTPSAKDRARSLGLLP